MIDSEDDLQHFGVKGMHWGKHKLMPAGGRADRILFGNAGAAKIKSSVAKGQSVGVARLIQSPKLAGRAVVVAYGVALGSMLLKDAGSSIIIKGAENRARSAGASRAAAMMADKQLSNTKTINLAFDAGSKIWA